MNKEITAAWIGVAGSLVVLLLTITTDIIAKRRNKKRELRGRMRYLSLLLKEAIIDISRQTESFRIFINEFKADTLSCPYLPFEKHTELRGIVKLDKAVYLDTFIDLFGDREEVINDYRNLLDYAGYLEERISALEQACPELQATLQETMIEDVDLINKVSEMITDATFDITKNHPQLTDEYGRIVVPIVNELEMLNRRAVHNIQRHEIEEYYLKVTQPLLEAFTSRMGTFHPTKVFELCRILKLASQPYLKYKAVVAEGLEKLTAGLENMERDAAIFRSSSEKYIAMYLDKGNIVV